MNKLTTKHLIFFMISVSVISLRSYCSVFIKLGSRDTWVATIIASILFIAYTTLIAHISKKTNTYDIKEIFINAYPKWLGEILLFIFAFGLFITSIETAAAESSSIHSNIFIETPIWYCLLFFIVPGIYVITRKFKTIVILVICVISLVLINNFSLIAFTEQYKHYQYLLPILGHVVPNNFIVCTLMILGSFSSIAIVFPFFKYITNGDKLTKYTFFTTLFSSCIAIFIIVSVLATFGPSRASNIFFPEFILAERIQVGGFIEFGDLLYLIRTVCEWFIKYILCATAIIYLYKDRIKSKKWFAIIYSVIVYIASWILAKNQFTLFNILRYYQLIILVIFLFIPLITYIFFYIKNKENKI